MAIALPYPDEPAPAGSVEADSADRSLVRDLKAGSDAAARTLVDEHWDAAHAAAFLMVRDVQAAEDIAQETILSVLRSIASFDPERPMRPWVHRIAVNRSIDYLRSPGRAVIEEQSTRTSPDETPVGVTDPEIAAALMALDPGDRAAVVLRHVFGYRATEIAGFMGEPASSTRSRIHRSLTRLRTEIEAKEMTR